MRASCSSSVMASARTSCSVRLSKVFISQMVGPRCGAASFGSWRRGSTALPVAIIRMGKQAGDGVEQFDGQRTFVHFGQGHFARDGDFFRDYLFHFLCEIASVTL